MFIKNTQHASLFELQVVKGFALGARCSNVTEKYISVHAITRGRRITEAQGKII